MRILIHYPTYPEFDMNSGAYRLFEIVGELVRRGIQVTFLAARETDGKYRAALEKMGVRCCGFESDGFDGSAQRLAGFLREGDFDVAVMVHYPEYLRLAPALATFLPRCRRVLDTVDLHFVRYQREAEVTGRPELAEEARRIEQSELKAIGDAEQVWVVTDVEREILEKRLPGKDVRVIPNIHRVQHSIPPREARDGIVFLGSYRHRPNVDAAKFFVEEVLPLVRAELPDVNVSIAGSRPPEEVQKYHSPEQGVIVTGFVPDHHAVLLAHRVGIAPLRFGAGMKGKIGEYFGCGLPCVTTTIGAEGMDLYDGKHVLVADEPEVFAQAVIRLYRDGELWEKLRAAGLEWIRDRVSPDAVGEAVEAALQAVIAQPTKPPAIPRRPILSALAPRRLGHLLRESWRVLRSGGWNELTTRVRVWRQNG